MTAFAFSQDPILNTSFENDPLGAGGWTLQTIGAGWIHQYLTTSSCVNTGLYSMAHLDDQGQQDDWLISPAITLPMDSTVHLTYWESSTWVEFIGTHEVCVTTDGGTTWTQIISNIPEENNFTQKFYFLEEYLGQEIQLGWHYTGDYSDQWYIDDVKIAYDDQAPEIIAITAENSILPIIGTYASNDMKIELTLYDQFSINSVKGYYSFNGGTTFDEIIFNCTADPYIWIGEIPAQSEVISGIIYFKFTDMFNNKATTENYNVEFIYDDMEPVITNVQGLLSLVGNNSDIAITFKDFSDVISCKGHYSKDNFISQYDFELTQKKINIYQYNGQIPAENEIIDSAEVYFTIEDANGYILTTDKYIVKWVGSYSEISNFDLRTSLNKNYVTSVKQQLSGTCWCFGAMATIESNLLMTGNWEFAGEDGEPDLSEYHLSWWCGFNEFFNGDIDPPTGDGLDLHMRGDYLLTTAYMSRGEGVVRDIDATSMYIEPERFSDYYHYFYARDIEWYTMDHQLNGIDLIKRKIVEHGAIGTSLVHTFVDPETFIHYQPISDPIYITHAVSIVGWDDDLITPAPEGPGAWLCKNSYGDFWGYDGFFWASYYTKHVAQDPEGGAISFQNVERMQYDAVYYHDYHGFSDSMTETNEAFNAFTHNGEEAVWLEAVSFFTAVDSVDYTVKIFTDLIDGELTKEVSTISGHIDHRGFHTVDLKDRCLLGSGDDFYIYLYLSQGGQPYDQSSYIPSAWLTYQSSASPGESYYKNDGAWLDLYDNSEIANPGTANFCIKGLVKNYVSTPDEIIPVTTELSQNYPNPFNPETMIEFSIDEDNCLVKIKVYNVRGALVSRLIDRKLDKGKHSVRFDASTMNSGVYYYSLEVNGNVHSTRKMIMIK